MTFSKPLRVTLIAAVFALSGVGFYFNGHGQQPNTFISPLTRLTFSAPADASVPNATLASSAVAESDAVVFFIESRSGVNLDENAKVALRESQTRTLSERSGMDTDLFADELAKALVERIRTATDDEYNDYVAGLLRSKKSIIVHQDSTGPQLKGTLVTGHELAKLAKSVRSGKYNPNFASYFAGGQLRIVVAAQIGVIAKTSPSFLTSTRNGKYLPPAQRLLLTYMILSGDAGTIELKPNTLLVGPNGKFVDIPFAFFLNLDTIKRLAA